MTSIRTCGFQSGVSGENKKRGVDEMKKRGLRTSNITALICCICVVNVWHRLGTCAQGEINGEGLDVGEWAGGRTATWSFPEVTGSADIGRRVFPDAGPVHVSTSSRESAAKKSNSLIVFTCHTITFQSAERTSVKSYDVQSFPVVLWTYQICKYTARLESHSAICKMWNIHNWAWAHYWRWNSVRMAVVGVKTFEGHASKPRRGMTPERVSDL